jgi:hypothetical protein
VMFGYTVAAGLAGTTFAPGWPVMAPPPPTPPATPTADWYWVTAKGDINGNGVQLAWVMGSSFTNEQYVSEAY